MSDSWVISKHAFKRVRKRLGLPKKSAETLVRDAQAKGIRQVQVSGSLRRYLDHFQHNNGVADRAVIYREYVFALRGQTLVTVYPLPTKYRGRKALCAT